LLVFSMKNQEMILIGIAAIMFIAAGYFAFAMPQTITTNSTTKTSPALDVLLNGLAMGENSGDYYYSYSEVTNSYPKTYNLIKSGGNKQVTIVSPLATKNVYITSNSTILCIEYTGNRTCEDITTNSNLNSYVAYAKSLFFSDNVITTSQENINYLYNKGYLKMDDSITKKTVNNEECSVIKYRLDYSNLTITEASKFQIGSSSPKIFDFEWCINNKTREVLEYNYKYNYGGQTFFTKISTVEIDWNTTKTMIQPGVLEQNAVSQLLDENSYVGSMMTCYQTNGTTRDDCILRLAIDLGNLNLCKSTKSNMDPCYVVMTAMKLKPEICDNVVSEGYKDDCYIELAGGLKNATWCNMIKNQSKVEFCQNVSIYVAPTVPQTPVNQTPANSTIPPQLGEIINKLEANTTETNSTTNSTS
ncbi:MAG: hypothetical protein ABID61_06525, partial [Candidatus Micrarchaeota archaeon]